MTDDLAKRFNSHFLRLAAKPAAAGSGKSGNGQQQQQKAAAPSRHFAIAPPTPKPAGMMPEFKPLFTAAPPVPKKPETLLPADIAGLAEQLEKAP